MEGAPNWLAPSKINTNFFTLSSQFFPLLKEISPSLLPLCYMSSFLLFLLHLFSLSRIFLFSCLNKHLMSIYYVLGAARGTQLWASETNAYSFWSSHGGPVSCLRCWGQSIFQWKWFCSLSTWMVDEAVNREISKKDKVQLSYRLKMNTGSLFHITH